jgi:hypothetical protein
MLKSESIAELTKALAQFQGEVRNPLNESVNPQYRSKYASLDVVINTVKPILAKYGLSFIQSTSTEGENVGVTTLLMHESGEWIESDTMFLPAYQIKSGGAKDFNAQGIGSSVTYGRRYQLSAILGISSEDDDDANGQVFGGAAASPQATKETAKPNNRDAAKERAAKAAEERKAAAEQNQAPASAPETPVETGSNIEPINDGQIKAINQMLKMVSNKKAGFDSDAFLKEALVKFGASELQALTFEQGKEVLTEINAAMRAK